MLIGNSQQWVNQAFDNEAEIEKVVLDNAELLFGSGSIVISQTRIKTAGGKGTVPDAIVVDLNYNRWYLVEVERAAHGTWEHIAPQVSKQLAALGHDDTRAILLRTALDVVANDSSLRESLNEMEIQEIGLHGHIEKILKQPPLIAIPIDDIPSDLIDWSKTLRHTVKVWRIQKYGNIENGEIIYSIPDDAVPDFATTASQKPDERLIGEIPETLYGGGDNFRRVLKSGLLHVGDELFMDYGPRGAEQQRFKAIVREDGLEIDGRVYSPSYAAVACMRKTGSKRKTANGWVRWKTQYGSLIGDLLKRLPENSRP